MSCRLVVCFRISGVTPDPLPSSTLYVVAALQAVAVQSVPELSHTVSRIPVPTDSPKAAFVPGAASSFAEMLEIDIASVVETVVTPAAVVVVVVVVLPAAVVVVVVVVEVVVVLVVALPDVEVAELEVVVVVVVVALPLLLEVVVVAVALELLEELEELEELLAWSIRSSAPISSVHSPCTKAPVPCPRMPCSFAPLAAKTPRRE